MNQPQKQEFLSEPSVVDDSWLLSLGDLLTLLLCFFLCLVASSPLNPSYHRGNPVLDKEIGDDPYPAVPTVESQFESGTPFAISFNGATYKEFTLLQNHFGDSGEFSNESKISALSVMDLDRYELEKATIETCTPAEGGARETDWYSALNHALSTRSQLIDSGIDEKRIEVSVLGPWCGVLGARYEEQKANLAGLIRFEMRVKKPDSNV